MIKVLFICHGNICRSTMAEFVMKHMAEKQGVRDRFEIASAATSREEIGNPVHYGTRRKLAEHNIGCEGKTARQITRSDYEYYDYLICMDRANIRNTIRIVGPDTDGKISLLLEHAGRSEEVADPWYTGNFDDTWDDVYEGCSALMDEILNND